MLKNGNVEYCEADGNSAGAHPAGHFADSLADAGYWGIRLIGVKEFRRPAFHRTNSETRPAPRSGAGQTERVPAQCGMTGGGNHGLGVSTLWLDGCGAVATVVFAFTGQGD